MSCKANMTANVCSQEVVSISEEEKEDDVDNSKDMYMCIMWVNQAGLPWAAYSCN